MVFGVGYLWFFQNKTNTTILDAEFNFELTNLQIEGAEDETSWHIELLPGQTVSRKLLMIDPA